MQPLVYKNLEISLLQNNEADIQATAECFIQGYYKSHPLFVGLQIEKEDFYRIIVKGIREAIVERPLQQLIAKDSKDKSKVIGVYLVNDFGTGFSDYKMARINDEIKKSNNKQYYQTVRVAILKEYQCTGIYQKLNQMQFYAAIEFKLSQSYIDFVYNYKMHSHPKNYLDAIAINSIDIREWEYKGKQVFKDQKYVCAVLQMTPFTSKLAKEYHSTGKQELTGFYKQYIDFYKGIPQNQIEQQEEIKSYMSELDDMRPSL
ncbi:hypothetical protein PPERSA_02328 [Pseudocohnilembus persalinus]|uniref:Acyl-CoA N-acyltransferase n=1 Tax=Pseudocohnilembus persalinus TaxID=266149 RepID=A0A0V0QU61_PSEPJ|nr:hypothetical protein PPERSA_02328 [Pseudocohnilembus persalinus]|eukprot:KRX05796.1 hypothetical protein PPERSA_02328 [Pseudocohnilembus persalinus]